MSVNQNGAVQYLQQRLVAGAKLARFPLFVLGSGISYGVVPPLKALVSWLRDNLPDTAAEGLRNQAQKLSDGQGPRRDAAEFFHALQQPDFDKPWRDFSKGFLTDGLVFSNGIWRETRFEGMLKKAIKPTDAHGWLASLMHEGRAHALSLNFDGLTHKALCEPLAEGGDHRHGLVLHRTEDVRRYYCGRDEQFIPAVIKVRGDVFYAKCGNQACPQSREGHPLDRLGPQCGDSLRCPICNEESLRLQFSFPGFRAKEEVAYPMLWEVRRFLGGRVSAIIMVGISGRWDRYLLDFLFDFAQERQLLLVDAKRSGGDDSNLIRSFQQLYYPSVPEVREQEGAAFLRVEEYADNLLPEIGRALGVQDPPARPAAPGTSEEPLEPAEREPEDRKSVV